jgi:predicted nucleic-acid-binding Zn-ribbon protein
MPSLEMTMEIREDFPEVGYSNIGVHTKTKLFFDKIFAINNTYTTIYHTKSGYAKYHIKKISQPNVTQTLEVEYAKDIINYSTGKQRHSDEPVMDFFSMLMHIRNVPQDSIEFLDFVVDMEGEFFRTTFEIEKEEMLEIAGKKYLTNKIKINYKKVNIEQESVLDYTDIFFWKIASESGGKYIWLEKNEKPRLIKAKFSEGKTFLEAKLIEGK